MKQAGEYGKRVKRLFAEMVRKFGKPAASDPTDPLEQLIVGILASCTTYAKAHAVFKKLQGAMVDLNELRVTPAVELAEAIGESVPRAREKAHRIIDALNAIRRRQDSLDISFLQQRGRREAREYLESLEGVDRMAAASVVVYSLGGHAVPVDELARYVLQKEEVVDPALSLVEVQAFLERQIGSAQVRLFAELLNRYVAAKGARVPLDKMVEPAPAGGDGAALRPQAGADHAIAQETTKPPTAGHKPIARTPEPVKGKAAGIKTSGSAKSKVSAGVGTVMERHGSPGSGTPPARHKAAVAKAPKPKPLAAAKAAGARKKK